MTGRREFRDRRAHVARAENAERSALLLLGVPFRHIGDAHREGAAGNADPQRRDQERRVVIRVGEKEGHHRSGEHRRGVDEPAAILISPDAEDQADQRSREDRRATSRPNCVSVSPRSFLI